MSYNLTVKNRNKGESLVGMMPAVLYGSNAKSTSVFIDKIAFRKAYKYAGESGVLKLDGDSNQSVLIHDVQVDPVSGENIHADLFVIEKGAKMHINIPLRFTGEAPAAKLGGNVVKVLQDLSLEIDPSNAPHDIEIDLTSLINLQSNITVGDIKLPVGATLYHLSESDIIVSIVAQSTEDLNADVVKVDMEAIVREEKTKKEDGDDTK
jgi:large subunit ribosomal protein L25